MDAHTYWNEKGKLQSTYTKEWNELVPGCGKTGSLQGEVLRASSRLYHRWYNDGDRISNGGPTLDSSAENAWGFLHGAVGLKPDSRDLAMVRWLAENTAAAVDDPSYEAALESLADAAILFAATRPLIPADADMCDAGWRMHCRSVCCLEEPPEEDDYAERMPQCGGAGDREDLY